MLEIIIILTIIGLIIIRIGEERTIFRDILIIMISIYIINLLGLINYNWGNEEFQYRVEICNIPLGVDGVSIGLIIIMSIINPIVILIIRSEPKGERKRMITYYMILTITIYILFMSLNILIFFLTFEIIVIPLMIFISKWGSKHEFNIPRLEAALRLYMFTIGGSILVMIAIIIIAIKYQTLNFEHLHTLISKDILEGHLDNLEILRIVWSFFIVSFFTKIPIFPTHIWLPYAHLEASTIGSIILAAIILKVATYGIYRYCISLFNYSNPLNISSFYLTLSNLPFSSTILDNHNIISEPFMLYIEVLLSISLIFISFVILRNLFDLKKMIAYSSILHMNLSLFGFFSNNLLGLYGGTLLMFTHALISAPLFYIISLLYLRYHNRNLFYFSGLSHSMPLFSLFYLFITFANLSIPIFFSFIPEFFILVSCASFNFFTLLPISFSLFLFNCFGFWQSCRLLFGSISPFLLPSSFSSSSSSSSSIPGFSDLSLFEFLILFPFIFFSLFFSFFSSFFSSLLFPSLSSLLH